MVWNFLPSSSLSWATLTVFGLKNFYVKNHSPFWRLLKWSLLNITISFLDTGPVSYLPLLQKQLSCPPLKPPEKSIFSTNFSLFLGLRCYAALVFILKPITSFNFSVLFFWSIDFFRERENGRQRETSICCSTYLCIHWLILVCALSRDQIPNLSVLGWHCNQLSLARTGYFVLIVKCGFPH